jgi:XTP/dITP diphosphohydrolase
LSLRLDRPILVATGNLHKIQEVFEILAGHPIRLLKPADVGGLQTIEEDGTSFRANAVKKANAACAKTGLWCLADDSGIEARALNWRPGVHSARFAGEQADDAANRRQLIEELRGHRDRYVRFRCVIALARPHEDTRSWEGVLVGECLEEPRGTGGFGYDPLVLLPDLGRTVAELGPAEKHARSHRGQALRAFADWLREHVEETIG